MASNRVSPKVFEHFFAQHPEHARLFRRIDPSQPPHGCGQMVFETLMLLSDQAEGKPHVAGYLSDLYREHQGFGVAQAKMYGDFLASLNDVVATLLQEHWTADEAQAWLRQTDVMLAKMQRLSKGACPWPTQVN